MTSNTLTGGIDSQGEGTAMNLTGCTITSNRAVGGSNGFNGQALGGGGLNIFCAVMTMQHSSVVGNQALGPGTTPSVDAPGTGFGEGSGIVNATATLTVTDSSIASNLAAEAPPPAAREATPSAGGSTTRRWRGRPGG